jgi:catechol 2,3-dioxygenase-like lactoylglutathione lyase family enzyme
MAIEFRQAVPVLASLNIPATEKFYQDKLGFKTINNYGNYLLMQREGLALHFTLTNDKYIAENTSCYVYVSGVDELYAECEAAGVVHPNGKLSDQFYGVREFSILDGDGNLIRFGQLSEG